MKRLFLSVTVLVSAALSGCASFYSNKPEDLFASEYKSAPIVVPENISAVNERVRTALARCYGATPGSVVMVNGIAVRAGGGDFQVQEAQKGDTKQWLVLAKMAGRYMLGIEVVPIDANSSSVRGYAGNWFWQRGLNHAIEEVSGKAAKCPA